MNTKKKNRPRPKTPKEQEPKESRGAKALKLASKPVVFTVTAVFGALLAWGGVYYIPRVLNAIDPSRPVVKATVIATSAPTAATATPAATVPSAPTSSTAPAPPSTAVPAANATGSTQETGMPLAYNAYAFPAKLSAAELADLNRVVAAGRFGNSGPDDDALAWMRAHGSFDVGAIRARVVVQAIDQPVRVVGVEALVEKKSAPLAATILYTPPEGSDEVEKADLDLDAQHPVAPVFAQKTISLQPGESTVLDVHASATRFAVVWRIGVDVVADGRAQTVAIGSLDSGPFRTTGLPDRRPKVSGTGGEYLNRYPDPWWFRGSFETPDEKPVYVRGLPPAR